MKLNTNKTLVKWVLIVLVAMIAILLVRGEIQKKKLEKTQLEVRKWKIKQDSLLKLSDGYYRKLVADTLTKNQLKKLAEDIIELKGRKPVVVQNVTFVPKEVEKLIDDVVVKNDTAYIEDYYPSKESPFLKYTNKFSISNQKGFSKFKFNPVDLAIVLTQRDDGIFEADIKGPEFLNFTNVDIQAIPLTPPSKDNFGWLFGVGYGKDFNTNENFFDIDIYARIKRFYIGGGVTTSGMAKGGIKIEF